MSPSDNTDAPQRKPGRPPDPEAATRLKAAALRLVRDKGYANVSIAEIIRDAQVSRQTLYNRWTGKAELVMEAFHDMADVEVPMPQVGESSDYCAVLSEFLGTIFEHLTRDGHALCNLIGSAQDDPAFREIFWRDFVHPRDVVVQTLLRAAQAAGALDPARDPVLLSELIHGAFWYRLLNGQALTRAQAEAIAVEIFRIR